MDAPMIWALTFVSHAYSTILAKLAINISEVRPIQVTTGKLKCSWYIYGALRWEYQCSGNQWQPLLSSSTHSILFVSSGTIFSLAMFYFHSKQQDITWHWCLLTAVLNKWVRSTKKWRLGSQLKIKIHLLFSNPLQLVNLVQCYIV